MVDFASPMTSRRGTGSAPLDSSFEGAVTIAKKSTFGSFDAKTMNIANENVAAAATVVNAAVNFRSDLDKRGSEATKKMAQATGFVGSPTAKKTMKASSALLVKINAKKTAQAIIATTNATVTKTDVNSESVPSEILYQMG